MPLPLIPLIGAGASLLGGALNSASQGKANKAQRDFEWDMYQTQRGNALADRAFENEYNSPAAQMKRLQEAGLNPNLVYGSGAAQSQSVSTKQTPSAHIAPQSLRMGDMVNGLVAAFLETQKLQAQTDNIKAMTSYAQMNEAKSASDVNLKNQQYAFNEDTWDNRKNVIFETWLNKDANTAYTKAQNRRNDELQPGRLEEQKGRIEVLKKQVDKIFQDTLMERAQRERLLPAQIEKLQQELKNLQQDELYKKVQNKLWEKGVNPNSLMGSVAPLASKLADELIAGVKATGNKVKSFLDAIK